MFNERALDIVKQVILSWQVIAVTIAILFFNSLIFYVARLHPKKKRSVPVKRPKVKKSPKQAAVPVRDEDEEDDRADLAD